MQGVHPCDRRRSISEYKPIFPAIDFSLVSVFFMILTFQSSSVRRKILWPWILDSLLMGDVCIFLQIESDADILWKPNTREKDEELARRAMKFLDWWFLVSVAWMSWTSWCEIWCCYGKNSSCKIWIVKDSCAKDSFVLPSDISVFLGRLHPDSQLILASRGSCRMQ